jgi:hypothetical protein
MKIVDVEEHGSAAIERDWTSRVGNSSAICGATRGGELSFFT